MAADSNILRGIRKILVLNLSTSLILVVAVVISVVALVYYSQALVEQGSLPPINSTGTKEQYEIAKLAAEIRQIRSDTSGSLFWLKLIAILVTVGGAVSGYLVGQNQTTKKRIEFENRKNIDSAYQALVLELADKSALLRAAAAVKLGTILGSFPTEWTVSETRKEQLIQLTKQVLAASLSIERNPKVLKTLTIALVSHKRWADDLNQPARKKYADVRELDLSGAKAADAYWAWVDFSYSDFYRADLTRASFRKSVLDTAQFRDSNLQEAVFVDANCHGANFKLADLRNADLTNATLVESRFEGAKVSGCILTGAKLVDNPDTQVDTSAAGDGSQMISLREWIASLPEATARTL